MIAAVLAVVLIGGGGALVAKNLTFFTQQDLVDRDETVTLVVPTDWWDETSPRAGHADGTGDDVSIAPDVEASSSDERLYVAVWVDRRPDSSDALEESQKEFAAYNCRENACTGQSTVTSLMIDGHEARQQTVQLKADGSYPAATAILTTILSKHRLVSVYAEGDNSDADHAQITTQVLIRD